MAETRDKSDKSILFCMNFFLLFLVQSLVSFQRSRRASIFLSLFFFLQFTFYYVTLSVAQVDSFNTTKWESEARYGQFIHCLNGMYPVCFTHLSPREYSWKEIVMRIEFSYVIIITVRSTFAFYSYCHITFTI